MLKSLRFPLLVGLGSGIAYAVILSASPIATAGGLVVGLGLVIAFGLAWDYVAARKPEPRDGGS